MSDLHLEFSEISQPDVEADITILGGDIFTKEEQLPSDLCDFFKSKMVIGIAGNHEFYRHNIDTYIPRLYDIYERHNGIYLENDILTVNDNFEYERVHGVRDVNGRHVDDVKCNIHDGIRFIGGTLWSDFKLFAGNDLNKIRAHASHIVGSRYTPGSNDFWLIREANRNYRRYRPLYAAMRHQETRRFIESALSIPFDGINYVITHHAPAPDCVPDKWKDDIFSAAYASDLLEVIKTHTPDFWQYGHLHESNPDLNIDGTQMIWNPRGYPGRDNHAVFNQDGLLNIECHNTKTFDI